MASSSSSSSSTTGETAKLEEEFSYSTKAVQFLGRTVTIVLQKRKGPFALVCICNILSLKNKLQLNPSIPEVPQEQLLELVADRLSDLYSKIDNKDENLEQKLKDAIDFLPRLASAIGVNFTQLRAVFDLLDIPYYVGRDVDPQEHELCVLYRYDNFYTLFKYEGELYVLASDQAFINQPDRVWEKLNKEEEGEGECIGYSSFKSYAVAYGRWKASPFTKWLDKNAWRVFITIAKYRVALAALTEARKEKGILEATLVKVRETMVNQTRPWMIIELENLMTHGHILVADLDDVKALSFLKANQHFRCGVILGMWRSPAIFATDPTVMAALDELGIEHRMGETSFEAGSAFQKFCRRLAAYLLSEEDVKRLTVQFEEAKESFNVAEMEFETLRREAKEITYQQSWPEPLRDEMKPWIQFLLTCNHIILDSVDDVEPFYYLMAIHDYTKGHVHTFNSAVIEEFKNHRGYKRFVKSGMALCYCHGRQSRLTSVALDERWKIEDEEAFAELLRRNRDMPEEWMDEH